jgi:Co/Zn/Cd efflux system component
MGTDISDIAVERAVRRAVAWVAGLNLAYFTVEFAVAVAAGSVALFADSVDFLEDASINLLILLALGRSPAVRAQAGMGLALLIMLPAAATLWTAWSKVHQPVAPDVLPVLLAGAGALVVNLCCAFLLARHRRGGGSLMRGAFLSARNDALANIAIMAAAVVTAGYWHSAWPDLIVGMAIALMNMDAAHEVWTAARREARAAA